MAINRGDPRNTLPGPDAMTIEEYRRLRAEAEREERRAAEGEAAEGDDGQDDGDGR